MECVAAAERPIVARRPVWRLRSPSRRHVLVLATAVAVAFVPCLARASGATPPVPAPVAATSAAASAAGVTAARQDEVSPSPDADPRASAEAVGATEPASEDAEEKEKKRRLSQAWDHVKQVGTCADELHPVASCECFMQCPTISGSVQLCQVGDAMANMEAAFELALTTPPSGSTTPPRTWDVECAVAVCRKRCVGRLVAKYDWRCDYSMEPVSWCQQHKSCLDTNCDMGCVNLKETLMTLWSSNCEVECGCYASEGQATTLPPVASAAAGPWCPEGKECLQRTTVGEATLALRNRLSMMTMLFAGLAGVHIAFVMQRH